MRLRERFASFDTSADAGRSARDRNAERTDCGAADHTCACAFNAAADCAHTCTECDAKASRPPSLCGTARIPRRVAA